MVENLSRSYTLWEDSVLDLTVGGKKCNGVRKFIDFKLEAVG